MTANDYREELRKSVCEVTFTKKNGEERVMLCSLMPKFLPDGDYDDTREPSDTTVNVVDLEKIEWRSFNVDKVTDFTVVT